LCHVHPQATSSWKQGDSLCNTVGLPYRLCGRSVTFLPRRGLPGGEGKRPECAICGVTGQMDSPILTGRQHLRLERASKHVYNSSAFFVMKTCSGQMTREGSDAHLYYKQVTDKGDDLQCISCHLNSGH
jgi:hypothetical protein